MADSTLSVGINLNVNGSNSINGLKNNLNSVAGSSGEAQENLNQVKQIVSSIKSGNISQLATATASVSTATSKASETIKKFKRLYEDSKLAFKKGQFIDYIDDDGVLFKAKDEVKAVKQLYKSSMKGLSKQISSNLKDSIKGVAEYGKVILTSAITWVIATIAAGIALINNAIKKSEIGDQIDKQSQKSQMSYKGYQQMSYIFERSGVSAEQLTTSMKKLSKSQSQAISGNKNQVKAFNDLGISLKEIKSTNPEQLFKKTTKALQGMEDKIERTRIATQIFGQSANELNPILNMSADDMDKLTRYYDSLGGTMSNKLVESSARLQDAITDLKTAWSGLGNTLAEVVMPAVINVVKWLTQAVAKASQFFQIVFGISHETEEALSDSMDSYTESTVGAEKETKKLLKLISGFDELNIFSNNDDSNNGTSDEDSDYSGALSKLKTEIDDPIELPESWKKIAEWINEHKEEIVKGLEMIAGAFLLLKSVIAGIKFGKFIKELTSLGDVVWMIVGVGLAIAGTIIFVKAFIDAWKNGVDWENLTSLLAGFALVVGGLALAFGPTVAAIALIVGGIALLVLGIKDWIEKNELTTESFVAIEVGIAAICIALAILTGSWIPLAIGAIVGIALAVYKYWDEIKAFLAKAWEWLKELPEKLATWFHDGVSAAYNWFVKILGPVGTWFDEHITQPLGKAVEKIKKFFEGLFLRIGEIWEGIKIIIEAYIKIVGDKIKQLWEDCKKIWDVVASWVDEHVITPIQNAFTAAMEWLNDKIITPLKTIFDPALEAIKKAFSTAFEAVKTTVKNIFNGIIGFIESGINKVIGGINGLLGGFNNLTGKAADLIGKDYGGVTLIPQVSLPRLASGGVINQPTIAMVGEYAGASSNPEIITPENKMREVFSESNGQLGEIFIQVGRSIVQAINEQDNSIVIGDDVIAKAAARGNKSYQMRTGMSLI